MNKRLPLFLLFVCITVIPSLLAFLCIGIFIWGGIAWSSNGSLASEAPTEERTRNVNMRESGMDDLSYDVNFTNASSFFLAENNRPIMLLKKEKNNLLAILYDKNSTVKIPLSFPLHSFMWYFYPNGTWVAPQNMITNPSAEYNIEIYTMLKTITQGNITTSIPDDYLPNQYEIHLQMFPNNVPLSALHIGKSQLYLWNISSQTDKGDIISFNQILLQPQQLHSNISIADDIGKPWKITTDANSKITYAYPNNFKLTNFANNPNRVFPGNVLLEDTLNQNPYTYVGVSFSVSPNSYNGASTSIPCTDTKSCIPFWKKHLPYKTMKNISATIGNKNIEGIEYTTNFGTLLEKDDLFAIPQHNKVWIIDVAKINISNDQNIGFQPEINKILQSFTF